MRGRGGQLINLFSRLENHLQYDILSAFSLKKYKNFEAKFKFSHMHNTKSCEKHCSIKCNIHCMICGADAIFALWSSATVYGTQGGNSVWDTLGWYSTPGHGIYKITASVPMSYNIWRSNKID